MKPACQISAEALRLGGEAVKLTVNASEEEPLTGIVCLNYRVYFDPALFELDAQASASGMDGVKLTALKTDEDGKSYYAVSLLDPTSEGLGVKGDLYSLVFKLKDDAAAGAEGTFTITKAHVYTIADGAMQTVENGAVENGTLTVKVAAQPVPEVVFGHSSASGKPMLTWDAVPGAESYNVYRAESEDGPYTRINSTTATSYVNTGAKEGVTYYYKVTAVSASGESEFSNIVSGQAKAELQKPAAPVVKIGSSASSGKPMLTWSAVTGAESYNVYRAESADGVYTKINTTTATSYVNTGAKEGVTYYYKVTAVNDIGESDASNVVSGQTKVTPQKPSAPVVRIGHSASSGKPMLKWNTVTGATSYNIYRAESATGTYTRINTTTATSYTNTGAKEGVTYYYKVTAVNGVGESAYSNVVSGKSKSTAPVTTTPVVTMGHSAVSGKPMLTWKAVTGAASYRVPCRQQGRHLLHPNHHQRSELHQHRRGAGHRLLLQGGGPERCRQGAGHQRCGGGQGRPRCGRGLLHRQRQAPADVEGCLRRHGVPRLPQRDEEQRLHPYQQDHGSDLRQHRRKGQHDLLLQGRGREGYGSQRLQQYRYGQTVQVRTAAV